MSIFSKIFSRKSATNSHQLMQMMLAGDAADSGITVNQKTAMTYASIFSVVRGISESIGMLPIALRDLETKKKIENHRVHRLISLQPNDFQTALEFWEMCGAMLAGRGNFYAFINRVNGEVRELLPVDPDTVETKQKEDYSVVHLIRLIDGTLKEFDQTEILHIKLFTLDGVTGVNPITYARNSIGLGMAADKQSSKFFKSGSRPDGILTTDQALKKDQADHIAEQWEERHSGSANAHKISVLGNGAKYNPIAISPADAQMLESRKFQRSEIASMFNYPLHRLGDLENAHHSNMEAAGQEYVTYCLMPYLVRIEQRIRISLLDESDSKKYYARFNAAALVRGDLASRGEFYVKMLQNGVYNPNRVLALEDEPPRKGGDIYMTPLNMAIDGKPIQTTPKGKENEQK